MKHAHWTPQPTGHPAIRAQKCSGRVRVRFADTDVSATAIAHDRWLDVLVIPDETLATESWSCVAGRPVWVDADVLTWIR